MSLRTYKKTELKEMCQKLHLSDDGLKNDLEDRLQNYLDQSGRTLENIPELADHFIDLPVSPSTARKAARKSIALLTGGDESDVEAKTQDLSKSLHRQLEHVRHEVSEATEISPSKVAQWAEETKRQVLSNAHFPTNLTTSVGLSDALGVARASMSQVGTVALISVVVEGAKMTKALVPLSYEVRLGGFGAVTAPDLLTFLSVDAYWKPILTWLSFQIVPLLLSTLFNFRAAAVNHPTTIKKGRSSGGRAATNGSREGYSWDPFTFALSKLLMVYIAFNTSFGAKHAWNELALVQHIVGNETFVIGTAVSLIYAFYEAAL